MEWIEITVLTAAYARWDIVSTLAVEWIEILNVILTTDVLAGLHPRGGVD